MRDADKTIGGMLDKQKVVYLSAVDADGFPQTKAMLAPRVREGIRVLYLTTNTSSQHVAQLRANPKACLYVCDTRFFRGVTLRGTVEVLEDAASKEILWRLGDTMYYTKGVTDPDYCVLRFTVTHGRYYASFKKEDFTLDKCEQA